MQNLGWVRHSLLVAAGGLVLAGLMGQGCPSPVPGPDNSGPPVTVELIDLTSNPVDPFLWADPGTLFTPEEVMIPANFIDVGDPLNSGDIVTVTLDCIDAGTLLTDADLLLAPSGTLPSANLILVREGEHYSCGDTVSFYFEVDASGNFFTTVDVNGVNIPF
jgi:hypothetical protein